MKILSSLFRFLPRKSALHTEKEMEQFAEDYANRLRFVETTESGFIIKDIKDIVHQKIQWHSVNDATFTPQEVTFQLSDTKKLSLSESDFEGWHLFIQQIPEGFSNFDYRAVRQFFAKLKGCELCGLMAVDENNECLACGESWDKDMAEVYDSKEDYIRDMQLVDFEPKEGQEPDISPDLGYGFKADPNWKPVVTTEDFIKNK